MTSILSDQTLHELITEIETASEALAYFDDVKRGRMDEHTDTVVVMCGSALHHATLYLSNLRDADERGISMIK